MGNYSFEKFTSHKIESSDADLKILDERLNLKGSLSQSNIKNKINSLFVVYHGNINWYLEAIRREKIYKTVYMIFTALMIILLPIGLLLFSEAASYINSELGEEENKGIEFYASFLIAILTSIFGFHQILNAWLAKRKLLSIFHEASSGLISNLYAFEDKWNNVNIYDSAKSDVVTQEFDDDIEKIVSEGRQIFNNERKKYYEFIENPEVDLGNIFSTSFGSASNVFSNFKSKRFERKLIEREAEIKGVNERKELVRSITSLNNEITELQIRLAELKREMELASKEEKTSIQIRCINLITKIDAKKEELINKKSKL